MTEFTSQKQPQRDPGLRQSVHLTFDAARRMCSPQTYKAFGRIRPLIPLWGTRPTTTKNNNAPKKQKQSSPNCRLTRALLCCACLFTTLTPTCTHDPLTDDMRLAREIPLPHPNDKTKPHEKQQAGNKTEMRREDLAETPHDMSDTPAAKHMTNKIIELT